MTEPLDDELRRAMSAGAAGFSTAANLGDTRNRLVGRVHRRQRQVFGLGGAVLLIIVVAAGALASGPSAGSPSRQVAAQGAANAAATSTTPGAVAPGLPGGGTDNAAATSTTPGPGPSTGSGRGTGAVPGSVAPGPPVSTGGAATTVAPPATTVAPVTVPATTTPTATPVPGISMVRGTVRFSPVCPVEQVPPNPACAPRPGPAHIQLLRGDGTVAAQGDAGASGDFAIPVPPGSYAVRATTTTPTPTIGRGCTASPAVVTVPTHGAANVAVSCDTGIR